VDNFWFMLFRKEAAWTRNAKLNYGVKRSVGTYKASRFQMFFGQFHEGAHGSTSGGDAINTVAGPV
jgi:hypothetical protein